MFIPEVSRSRQSEIQQTLKPGKKPVDFW